jgi:hypothetical protein
MLWKNITYGWSEVLERLGVDEREVHAAEEPDDLLVVLSLQIEVEQTK